MNEDKPISLVDTAFFREQEKESITVEIKQNKPITITIPNDKFPTGTKITLIRNMAAIGGRGGMECGGTSWQIVEYTR